jgi:hypothetical protein
LGAFLVRQIKVVFCKNGCYIYMLLAAGTQPGAG